MGQVPLTRISGSVTDLLCGLRRCPLVSLGLVFPKKKISHSLFLGMLKDQRRDICRASKDAQMKCTREALI